MDENPKLWNQLRLVIFEKDNPKYCNYKRLKIILGSMGFTQRVSLFREVWIRDEN